MKTKEQIERIKAIPITDYLLKNGLLPVKESGSQLIYYSPKSEEGTPSFFVNPAKNVFNDFSGVGEKGDIIRLVQYLNDCDFNQAVAMLESTMPNIKQSFSFSGQNSATAKQSAIKVVSVQPLQNRALLAYVESRYISATVAATYLQEVHYKINQKQYYAVCFGNDKGGYELRSKYFKGCTTPKWFKSIEGQKSDAINLFEGAFDFLSCCERFNTNRLNNPTIVLNSLSFLSEVLPVLKTYPVVNAFFDNDPSGKRAIERLKREGINVQDCSHYYLNYKDFNDHLMHLHRPK